MATDTLERTDAGLDVDVTSLIETAFGVQECCSTRKEILPCGGEVRGLYDHHDCNHGLLCQVHWDFAVQTLFPAWKAKFAEAGTIACAMCLTRFTEFDDFARLTPL